MDDLEDKKPESFYYFSYGIAYTLEQYRYMVYHTPDMVFVLL
jgi:hypothetical protein